MTHQELNSTDKIDLRASTLSLRIDEIMHVHIKAVEEFLTDDLMDIFNGFYEIGRGEKFLNLVTFEDFVIVNQEARKLAARAVASKFTIADAFVVDSIALKLVINFYIAFNKPSRPTRIFDTEEKAIEWLKTFS